MKVKNKSAVFAVAGCALAIVIFVAMLMASVLKTEKSILIKDKNGEVFATVEWDGVKETFESDNQFMKTYVAIAFDEAQSVIAKKENVSENKIKKYVFKNVTEIRTNFDKGAFLKLKSACEQQGFENTSCEIAISDLNGKLVAVFSVGNKENGFELSRNYVGSAIKPLSVFAPALESGKYNWSSMIVDSPVSKVQDDEGKMSDWPVNADGKYTYEPVAIVDSLINSTNTVAVKLLQGVGVSKSMDALEKKYGFNLDYERQKIESTDETEVLGNIALGYLYNGATVVDMAGNFQPFANGGVYTKPVAVDEVLDGDKVLYKTEYRSKRFLSESTAEIMNRMLQLVVQGGTGKNAKVEGLKVGGKTGTTSGNQDNWFVGFTPDYTCAVWHSFSEKGNVAPDIFADVFENVKSENKVFPHKKGVISELYCKKSGKLKGENCDNTSRGYYLHNKLPEICDKCNQEGLS